MKPILLATDGSPSAEAATAEALALARSLDVPLVVASVAHETTPMYGAKMPARNMARRVSFLIGLDGKIAHVTDTPSADTHLSEMKEAVEKLKKS